jgi:hypothetical protein
MKYRRAVGSYKVRGSLILREDAHVAIDYERR